MQVLRCFRDIAALLVKRLQREFLFSGDIWGRNLSRRQSGGLVGDVDVMKQGTLLRINNLERCMVYSYDVGM